MSLSLLPTCSRSHLVSTMTQPCRLPTFKISCWLDSKKKYTFFNWWKIFLQTCFLKTFWICYCCCCLGFLFVLPCPPSHRDTLHSLGWFPSSLWFFCLNLLSTKIAGMYYCVIEKLCHPPTCHSKFSCFLMLPPLSNISLPFLWNPFHFVLLNSISVLLFHVSLATQWDPVSKISLKRKRKKERRWGRLGKMVQ